MTNLKKDRYLIPLVVLSILGIIVSGYLTYSYFSPSGTTFCLTGEDCDIVRQSKYSSLLGIPVSVIGIFGFTAILFTTISPMTKRKKWLTLFALSTFGVAFSAYLTFVEFFTIKAICSYCVVSAVLILLILVFVLRIIDYMHPKSSMLNLLIGGIAIFALVITGSYSIHSSIPENNLPPSDPYQTALAEHLGEINARMYGSFQCPHCNHQKEIFGKAFENIEYVECHRRGKNARPSFCLAKGIHRYPTWEINGRFYEGLLPLERLAEISGFEGSSAD